MHILVWVWGRVFGNAGPEAADAPQSVLEMAGSPQIYENLAKSLAPGVFGPPAGVVHDIKKAVLLMLVGGVNKVTKEVRGLALMFGAVHVSR